MRPLAAFRPRWEGEVLVLVLQRLRPRMIWLGIAAVTSLMVCAMFASLAVLEVALAGLAVGVPTGALALWTWMNDRHEPLELRLSPEAVTLGPYRVSRDDVGTVSTQNRSLHVRSARSIFEVLHAQGLVHPPVELAQLAAVVRAWANHPDFGPGNMRPRAHTGRSLLDQLEPLGAEPSGTGVRFPIRERRGTDFLWPLLGAGLGALLGFVLGLSVTYLFIALWFGGAAGGVVAIANAIRRRAQVHIDDRGVSLVGRWSLSWDEIQAASVTDQHGVQLHTRDGGQTLPMASIRYAPVLAALLTDLADPDPEQHVPDGLRQMVARQDKGRQEG